MKRIFLSMLAAAGLLVTSCEKRDLEPTVGAGAEVPVTLSASMEGATTRAIANYGEGKKVNRAILEVYYDGEVYKRMVAPLTGTTSKTVDFDLRLISGREYNFVVWADKVNDEVVKEESYSSEDNTNIDLYYETNNGLDEITIIEDKDYLGCNDDERDAFYGVQTKKVEGATTVPMTLRRPFGQINVLTKLTGVKDSDLPEFVQVTYSTDIAHTFNALSEETSNYKALAWSNIVSVIESATSDVTEAIHLSTDYIFAPKDGQDLVDFSMEFFKADGTSITTNNKLSNIPVQRNYRTNVSGELLSQACNVVVSCDPNFTNGAGTDYDFSGNLVVADVAAVNKLISAAGAGDDVKITVKNIAASAAAITIPAGCAANSITINASTIDSEAAVSITGADYAGDVYFYAPIETKFESLTINTPLAHVEAQINAETANTITSASTFVLLEKSIVGELTATKGSVQINTETSVGTLKAAPKTGDNAEATIDIKGTVGAVESTEAGGEAPAFTSGITLNNETSYPNLKAAVAALKDGGYILLAPGTYFVSADETATSHDDDASYFLNITARNCYIGPSKEDEGKKIVIAGLPYENEKLGGVWPKQNLITVQGPDVNLKGLTFIANYNAYYKGCNKTIEMTTGATGLTVQNCTFAKGTDPRFDHVDGGCIWLGNDKDAMKATIIGCTFEAAGITVRPNTTATIIGCTFNEIRNGAWKCSLSNRGEADVKNCTFNSAVTSERGVVNSMGQGILNLTGCTFPASDITPYILTADNSVIIDNSTKTTYVGELAKYQGNSGESTTANPYFSLRNNSKIVNLNVTSTAIGNYTFGECSNLESAVISSPIIHDNAFAESSIKEAIFNGVETIGQQAFCKAHLTGDKDGVLTIPSTVKEMGNSVFMGAYNDATVYNSFKKVIINAPLKTIEQATFQACWNVDEVHLPETVESIEPFAFYGCGQLSDSKTLTVYITSPEVVKIDADIDNNIFKGLAATSNAAHKNDVSVTVKVDKDLVNAYKADANWTALMADTQNTYSLEIVANE